MKIVRYNPLNNFVPSTFGDLLENVINRDVQRELNFTPEVDIIKNEDGFEINLIAAGMTKSDFTLDINDNTLTLSGERKQPDNIKFLQSESRYGSFKRAFKLNDDIDQSKISAAYENGILKIVLPINKKKLEKKVIKID